MLKETNRKIGGDFEKYIAGLFPDAGLVRGSGSWMWAKGDVMTDVYCIQCKYTDKPYYTLKLSELIKSEKEASQEKKDPLFSIGIGGDGFHTFFVERLSIGCLNNYKGKLNLVSCNKSIKLTLDMLTDNLFILFQLNNKEYLYEITNEKTFIERKEIEGIC